jgi:diguanylate cyclase (GGDEF)-like protein/PAS domain S-box-containing protein
MWHLLGSTPTRVGYGIAGTVAADRRSVNVSDMDPADLIELVDPAYRQFLREHPIRSLLIVPMAVYGEVLGTLGVVRTVSAEPYSDEDVTALEALAERASLVLADAKRRPPRLGPAELRAIFEHSMDGVLFTAPDGRVLAANPAACEILQRTEAEICELGRSGLVVGEDPRAQRAVRQRELTGRVRAELPMRRPDGSTFIAAISSAVFSSPDGGELRTCVIIRDIGREVAARELLQRQAEELARLAHQDDLTSLLNRRGFLTAAEQALAFADREQVPVQLAFFDLDEFKIINDTHGHLVGDAVLVKLAGAISGATRAVDVVGRLGGDELVAMLYAASSEDAERVVARIVQEVEAITPGLPPASVAVGVAGREAGDAMTLDQLLHAADQKMYALKLRRRVLRHEGAPTPEP